MSDDSYWACVHELQSRGSPEVFHESVRLCGLNEVKRKILGIDVLAQPGALDNPFKEKSLSLLHSILNTDSRASVLHSTLVAISHLQEIEDSRGMRRIRELANDPDEHIRTGAVAVFLGRTDSRSISTMIKLSGDSLSEVRDWATFGLGTLIDINTSAIRNALASRLQDPDDETRCEAILGLAIRKDSRVREPLRKELNKKNVWSLAVEAAKEYGDSSLLNLL